ncbi:DASH family cryptochrome [Polynucleobacter sp. AP-Nino-20-G2]|uniref:DASH family cryptochrome n=1 Tax=Polynucleobacter sp. AP-Nino-20-G2 TaxID=2576917 RepID=UPI001BFD3BB3|nr:DASH family cryptochrome [Polynucleobacter sp. AP-Nino-20-G2]QWE16204.1 DASH family cryptochrome [Polynucleobacter sp. AP-Nino-20-G2]
MRVLIYWFRNDLRLVDNPAISRACLDADFILPVYLHEPDGELNAYGFERVGPHRKLFLKESLADLRTQLRALDSDLFEFHGHATAVFPQLMKAIGASAIYCEQIETPEEMMQVSELLGMGVELKQFWQSSMLDLKDLPFDPQTMPNVFTQFRQKIEGAGVRFTGPIAAPKYLPPPPDGVDVPPMGEMEIQHSQSPYLGGSSRAQSHLQQYLERRLPDTYKETRNHLTGQDYSSKFSFWLSLGCISARDIAAQINQYEERHGANDGTYWLWFELLWRDYFRFIHFKFGRQLYRARGLSNLPTPSLDVGQFEGWKSGSTGNAFVDAGMHELQSTGYLSNRMRQIVASYWIYDMQGDWRIGAAWFENQLADFDIYSNQGNWLYIAGRGTDPRGGRQFNVAKQAQDHDPQGEYRRLWNKPN